MKKKAKLWEWLLFPPIWLIILLVAVSITGLMVLSLTDFEDHPVAYVLYVTAPYSLIVSCVCAIKATPTFYSKAKQGVYSNPFGNRYMTNTALKVWISLLGA